MKKLFIFCISFFIMITFSSCYNTSYENAIVEENGEHVINLPKGEQLFTVAHSDDATIVVTRDSRKFDEYRVYTVYDAKNLGLSYIIREH